MVLAEDVREKGGSNEAYSLVFVVGSAVLWSQAFSQCHLALQEDSACRRFHGPEVHQRLKTLLLGR